MDDEVLLAEVIAALETSGLYVGPEAASHVTAEQQEQIRANLADLREADVPTYVLIVDLPSDVYGGRADNLVTYVRDETEEPGTYVYTSYFFAATTDRDASYSLDLLAWEAPEWVDADGAITGVNKLEPEAGAGLARATDAMAARATEDLATWEAFRDDVSTARALASQEESSRYDESGSWVTGPAGISLGIILLVVLLVALVRRRGGPGPVTATGGRNGAFVLPPSALDLVRAARDARTVTRARDELLALGEAIDDADLTAGADDAWQAALDHYDAARRVLRPEEPVDTVALLDGVGGLVLVQRGTAALQAARAGRAFTPTTPCFLNPLHGEGARAGDIQVGDAVLHAPLCDACRRDLKRKRRPEILDVMDDGEPRHYFDTDIEPWASTGMGALEPDLVTRLHRHRPSR